MKSVGLSQTSTPFESVSTVTPRGSILRRAATVPPGGRLLEELPPRRAVLPGRDRDLRGRGEHRAHVGLGGDGHAFLAGARRPGRRGCRRGCSARMTSRTSSSVIGGQELAHQGQLDVDAGAGLAGQEVRDVFAGVGAALALVALLPGALVLGQELAPGPVELGGARSRGGGRAPPP